MNNRIEPHDLDGLIVEGIKFDAMHGNDHGEFIIKTSVGSLVVSWDRGRVTGIRVRDSNQ